MTAKRFRKKPVEIDAVEYTGTLDNTGYLLGWIEGAGGEASAVAAGAEHRLRRDSEADPSNCNFYPERAKAFLVVHTLEGDMRADIGDWIIRGVQGEFYPCKPTIFDATYDKVEA